MSMSADPSDAPGHTGDKTPALRPEVASILATEHWSLLDPSDRRSQLLAGLGSLVVQLEISRGLSAVHREMDVQFPSPDPDGAPPSGTSDDV